MIVFALRFAAFLAALGLFSVDAPTVGGLVLILAFMPRFAHWRHR